MTVSELIEHLKKCPQELDVFAYYDGAARTKIDFGFLGIAETWDVEKQKVLILAERNEVYNLAVYNLADDSQIFFS